MHDRVVEANRAWYRERRNEYGGYRSSPEFLAAYTRDFNSDFGAMRLPAGARVLDACAGHGLLTRLFAGRGCSVVAVDVSAEMLEGVVGETELAEIRDYLERTSETFDAVAFGSALHHLWDFERVVRLAVSRLRPGGVIYVVAEPILNAGVARIVREFEFVWRKVRSNPGDVVAAVRRRLRFRSGSAPTRETVGLYAEVHAHGIRLDVVLGALDPAKVTMLRLRRTGPFWLRAIKRLTPGYVGDNFTLVATKSLDTSQRSARTDT